MTKRRNKKNKTLVIILLAVILLLLLAAVAYVYFVLWKPAEEVYHSAMETARTSSYEVSTGAIDSALKELEGNPFSEVYIKELTAKKDELKRAEFDRALEAGEMEKAASLAKDLPAEYEKKLQDKIAQQEEERRQEEERKRDEAYRAAEQLEAEGKDEEAEQAFLALGDYRDSSDRAAVIRERIKLNQARAVFTGNNYDEAAEALNALGTEEAKKEAQELMNAKEARRVEILTEAKNHLAAGAWHTAAAGTDSAWIAGDARFPEVPSDADFVFSGLTSIFYIKDGTVYTTGETFGDEQTIASLTDVVDIAPGLTHCAFLKSNGRVVGVGSNGLGRLNFEQWVKIVDVAAGAWHTVGLELSGYVQACGSNDRGQCDVSGWENITAVDAGLWHTVGLKSDGTVVACGDNTYGQCDVSGWTDVIAVSCGACYTVGLRNDGTVVACGDNTAGQCEVSQWSGVAAVAAGAYHTVGMRMDGSLVACGILPEELPENAVVIDTGWITEPQKSAETTGALTATAYVEGKDSDFGPWLYFDQNGAVTIFLDDTEERMPFRMDMIARAGKLPEGRVTEPGVTGNIIRMKSELPEIQARNANAVVAFTGDYIGFSSNRKGVMIRNGVTYYDRTETTTLAIMPEGTLNLYSMGNIRASQLVSQGVKDSFSFGPILIKDGKIVYNKDSKTITMRVVFGYTDPYHYVTLVTQRDRVRQMSYLMSAEVMQRYGVKVAYNLDGGHSTSLVFMGKELSLIAMDGSSHKNIRGLSDVIIFLHSEDVQP